MTAAVLMGGLFGMGALLVLTAQSRGRPQPSLKKRLESLQPDRSDDAPVSRERVFRTGAFEIGLRPALERAGSVLGSFFSAIGLDLSETASKLQSVGDPGGLTLFLGQKIAAGITGFAFLPFAASISMAPTTPIWLWLGAGITGFLIPDLMLRAKAEKHRRKLREQLAHFTDLVALAVSGGLGLESAIEEAINAGGNEFSSALRRYMRESRLRKEPPSTAVARMGEEMRLVEAATLASALATAETQGISLSRVLKAQARAIRERRRVELIEAGEKAHTRMALPIGLLIFPAFLIVVLYPAAVQLLQITK
jgi:tight adherence protein C